MASGEKQRCIGAFRMYASVASSTWLGGLPTPHTSSGTVIGDHSTIVERL